MQAVAQTRDTAQEVIDLPAAEAAEAVSGHEAKAGATEVAHGSGEGGGLPQFEFEYWGGQIVWLLLIFAVLYALFSRVFIPRLRRVVETREQTIAESLSAARQVQQEADTQAEAARNELAAARARSQKATAEAKARVQAEAASRQAAEEAKLGQHLAQAEDRIRVSRDQAMTNVRAIAAETTQFITEKLTGRPATAGEIEQALGQTRAV
jgi:F-type H+-transporting ATPase subunit b